MGLAGVGWGRAVQVSMVIIIQFFIVVLLFQYGRVDALRVSVSMSLQRPGSAPDRRHAARKGTVALRLD